MEETAFYHAVTIAVRGEYSALQRLRARFDTWEAAARVIAHRIDVAAEWQRLQQLGIGLLLIDDPRYPARLCEIPHPPFGLYFKGAIATASMATVVAIVGTRKGTAAGKNLTVEFGAALAHAGAVVVSGLAFGIDAAAHAGALQGRGPTIAVLANGLDKIYPSSHGRLARHIIEGGGAIVSEYPPESPPYQSRFLERNRIVSGLAHAVLAIEVPERSGVTNTARFALEQNRDVYVVPGAVQHFNYKGSNRLLRRGAILVTCPEELLEDLGLVDAAAAAAHAESAAREKDLSPDEAHVLAALRSASRALTIDEIIAAATLTSSAVNRSLTMLVLKNIVNEEGSGYVPRH